MSKLTYILLFCLILSSCSTSKQAISLVEDDYLDTYVKDIQHNNITRNDFQIKKVMVDYSDSKTTTRLICSIKYEINGNFYSTIRLNSGIEIARFLINRDSVFLVDRINKDFYYGLTTSLKNRYNIDYNDVFYLLGDVSDPTFIAQLSCLNGQETVKTYNDDKTYYFTLNCIKNKLNNLVIADKSNICNINYFYKNNHHSDKYPQSVEVQLKDKRLMITFGDIDYDITKVSFNKPKNYNAILIQ